MRFYALAKKFAIIGAHIRRDSVEKELNDMVNVYEDTIKKYNDVPTVIMGNFNAGSRCELYSFVRRLTG